MGKFKEHFCYDCEGTFKVKHEMDDDRYKITNCVFCGSELSEDDFSADDVEFDNEL